MASSTTNTCSVEGRKPRKIYVGTMERCYRRSEEYAAFLGIPYAVRPEGMKRYQAPETLPCDEIPDGQPLPSYTANVRGKESAQLRKQLYGGSSDCLYLNIFLPKHPDETKELLPVLVFFHGGGFTYGSNDADVYPPDPIIRQDLVFVTINYRLGIFGFMNAQSKECPGNAGLKDQVKALEWIRDNIECFKGDPNNVTISGCSAGGTCVNLHLISPVSKDLFHKAIVQSGGIYCPWGYRGHQCEQNQMLLEDPVFNQLFHAENESEELHRYADKLLREDRLRRHPKSFDPVFGPTVEKFREGAFISDTIEEMMKNVDHDKPVMAGIAKEEGLYQFVVNKSQITAEWVDDDQQFCQMLMDNFRWSSQTAKNMFREIRDKYFPDRSGMTDVDKDLHLSNLFRDMFYRRFYENFKFGPERTIHKNLYVYRFDHVSEMSAIRRDRMEYFDGWFIEPIIPSLCGATHGDELNYLFCPTFVKMLCGRYIYEGQNQNKEIEEVMNHMCSLWANFCRNGIPKSDFDLKNVEWRRHTEEDPCFLSIGRNLRLMEGSLFQEEWDWLNALVDPQPTMNSPAVTPE